ncbi:MAG TPA: putative Fe-S cluster assembly protein SufT [Gammaproteobacteria bacterium]|nr:putative Fe-S cluster assembly protein SufT [Gammaproteobacteria bacterium]
MYGQGDPVELQRDVLATLVPLGDKVVLPEGGQVVVTQSLGGSFTVYYAGNLARIAGEDADALGMTPPPRPQLPDDPADAEVERVVWDQMRTCYDPEIPVDIVELGLVYRCEITHREDGRREVAVTMTLTAPGCGMGDVIADDVRHKIEMVPTVARATVEVTFEPPWSAEMMTEQARLQTGMF